MSNKNIVVIGNCQARPIADLVSRGCNANITAIIINHLEKEEDYKYKFKFLIILEIKG